MSYSNPTTLRENPNIIGNIKTIIEVKSVWCLYIYKYIFYILKNIF